MFLVWVISLGRVKVFDRLHLGIIEFYIFDDLWNNFSMEKNKMSTKWRDPILAFTSSVSFSKALHFSESLVLYYRIR